MTTTDTTTKRNGWGGARPGSGPKRKPPAVVPAGTDMLAFLQGVALGTFDANATQVRAAVAAVQYTHIKKSDGGKKEEVKDKAAKVAATGRFSAVKVPRNVIGINAAKGGKREV